MKKILFSLFLPVLCQAQTITTIVGTGAAGYTGDDSSALSARIDHPIQLAIDKTGNIYFADYANNVIRKVDTSGAIYTIAGTGTPGYMGDGGPALAAELNGPFGVAVDTLGNVYIADRNNNCIRRINTHDTITTIAGNGAGSYSGDGGLAVDAQLWFPVRVIADKLGNIYIADNQNQRIRAINAAGHISTVAGNGSTAYTGDGGIATSAALNYPTGIWLDHADNLYIADAGNNVIRKVDTSGIITTIAGNGIAGYTGDSVLATESELSEPLDVTMDNYGNIFIADNNNERIRKVSTSGIITTLAGTGITGYAGDGGLATGAEFDGLNGMCFNKAGNILFVADVFNERIRQINFGPDYGNTTALANVTKSDNRIALYPNPNNGSFMLNGKLIAATDESVSIKITDVLGRMIYATHVAAQGNSITAHIETGTMLLPGVYMLNITSAGQIETCRFEVEK